MAALWSAYGFVGSSFNDANGNGVYDENEKAVWNAPLHYIAGGQYYAGLLKSIGYESFFWASARNDFEYEPHAWDSCLKTTGYIDPTANQMESYGGFVRCLAR